jgi:hypothetical protein
MMAKVLVYAYATGVFSSRKIARKLEEDVAFRVLGAENFPAHRTVCDFRKEHWKEFEQLFVQVVRLAKELGLVSLGTLAIDGSKVKANASKHKAMSYGRMKEEEKRLRKEIRGFLRQAENLDRDEDRRYGADRRGDELPEEIQRRKDRLARIQEAKRRLEVRQEQEDREAGRQPGDHENRKGPGIPFKRPWGEPEDRKQENFTDPDSRILKRDGHFEQGYNTQIAVDGEVGLIVGRRVIQTGGEARELLPMLDGVRKILRRNPHQVLADAGYRAEEAFRALERRKIRGYVAIGREGKRASPVSRQRKPATYRMKQRVRSPGGQLVYRMRKWIAEPPFGWIKNVLGFRQFSVRGLAQVEGEWNLVCLALNLRRMHPLTRPA